MENKKINFFILLLMLIISLIFQVLAQETPGLPSSLDQDPNEIIEQYKNKTETSGEYLKQEWKTRLIKGKYTGQVFLFIAGVFNSLNPFFKIVLGIEYSLSWAFIFAVIIWIILFLFISIIMSSFFEKKIFAFISGFVIASLIGLSGVIKTAVNVLNTMITQTWLIWVSLIITLIIGAIIIKLGGGLKKMIEKDRESQEKDKEKQNRKILDIGAKTVKEELKKEK